MRLFFASLALAMGTLAAGSAYAQFQPVVLMCGDPPAPCSAANPVPTGGGGVASDVNVTEFGGNAVVTGTGASGVGIPRVTVSNDSTIASTQASATARGGAITTGGTSQTIIAANAARKGFTIQNPCTATEQGIGAAESLYINLTNAATVSTNVNLAVLPPCSAFSMGITQGLVSTEAVTAIAATTAHIFYAKEF